MNEQAVATRASGTSLILSLSERWGVSAGDLATVVKSTIFRGDAAKATNEELVAFLQVCDRYDLNPFLREIYAFVGRSGGVFPIVGVDGWVNLVNRNPRFDGIEFLDHLDANGEMTAITCAMTIKGRQLPVKITEYMAECRRNTEPWQKWPRRMLRHKAYIQCARYAFGYHGLYDEDEVERIAESIRDTRGPIIEMPLSNAEAKALDAGNGGSSSTPEKATMQGEEKATSSPVADEPSPDEQAAIRAQEQAEAAAPSSPPKAVGKVDRGQIWNALLRRAKKENKTASETLQALTMEPGKPGKHNLTDLSDEECVALAKKLS